MRWLDSNFEQLLSVGMLIFMGGVGLAILSMLGAFVWLIIIAAITGGC
jgi:hypothetical protein